MKTYLIIKNNNEKLMIEATNASTNSGSLLGSTEYVKFWNENDELVGLFKIHEIQEFYVINSAEQIDQRK